MVRFFVKLNQDTDFHRYLVFYSLWCPGNPCSSVSPKWKFRYFQVKTWVQIHWDF